MDTITKGYIAAIIDGEGTITLTKDGKAGFRIPVISVASTTYEILQSLKEELGGVISSKKIYKKTHKPSWTWTIKSRKVISLLEEIIPYLVEPKKKARAQFIIDNYIKVTPRNGYYTPDKLQQKLQFEENFFNL